MGGVRIKSSPLPGGGPWRILPHCPGLLHNTTGAATRGAQEIRCICPRGLVLLEEFKQRRLKAERARKSHSRAEHRPAPRYTGVPQYMSSMAADLRSMPDLSRGRCVNRTSGVRVMNSTFADRGSRPSGRSIKAAKQMCEGCPVKTECGNWALTAENPAGGWGGVYGGLTWQERVDVKDQLQQLRKVIAGE